VDDELTIQLLAARDGDQLALSVVIRRLYPDVVRYCAVRVAPDVAEDVAQDVFLRVTKAVAGFEGRASARTWVLSIARRACVDAVRQRQRRRGREVVGAPDEDASASAWENHTTAAADSGVAIELLLDHLDLDRREAFVLTQLIGTSYQEAADLLAVPIGTIRSRVARAREDLVALLRA
jgi:RNA polymerase sigma-70 factor (ECF subfamily)